MSKHAVSPYQLKIWALFIIYHLAQSAQAKPYQRSWFLRFLLAFLYAQSKDEDRTHFDRFWKVATQPHRWADADRDPNAVRRSLMQREANGICLAVGEEPKEVHDRYWDERTRDAHAERGEKIEIRR